MNVTGGLLLDDPPKPQQAHHAATLDAARRLAADLTEWLAEPRERFARALEEFETGGGDDPATTAQVVALAAEFAWASQWLAERAREERIDDHVVATADGLALLSDAFNQRLERLTIAQQKELKNLLEKIL